MDLYCRKCGEPWDHYEVMHELPPRERRRFLNGEGCDCCDWGRNAPNEFPEIAEMMKVARDMLGDDVDGIAAIMDDYSF